jgi:predicted nuclease with RNAse H fold
MCMVVRLEGARGLSSVRSDRAFDGMLAGVLTAGTDLSAEDAKTCLAVVDWLADRAVVTDLRMKVSNPSIVGIADAVGKIGIDCPFGWPVPFVEFVAEHDRGVIAPRTGRPLDWRRNLANRRTDLFIRDQTRLVPLSVSADRIAHAAMRCAALLAEMAAAGVPVDRTGRDGKVVEVYPAASLLQWQLTHGGYKHAANTSSLAALVDALLDAAPWLDLGSYAQLCRSNDDAFDAVVAAVTARAVVCGQTHPPTSQDDPLAIREGWIALPIRGSLGLLVFDPA